MRSGTLVCREKDKSVQQNFRVLTKSHKGLQRTYVFYVILVLLKILNIGRFSKNVKGKKPFAYSLFFGIFKVRGPRQGFPEIVII